MAEEKAFTIDYAGLFERTKRCWLEIDKSAAYTAFALLINKHKDIRVRSQTKLVRLLVGLGSTFHIYSQTDYELIKNEVQVNPENDVPFYYYRVIMDRTLKQGFVSSLFFSVESSIRAYLGHFYGKDSPQRKANSYKISSMLIHEVLGIPDEELNDAAYHLLRRIRNSLHNNGFHHPTNEWDSNVAIDFRGETYVFKDFGRVSFVSWDLILDLTEDLGQLLFQIAHHQRLRPMRLIKELQD